MLAATFGKRDRDVLASSAGASNRSWMEGPSDDTETSLLAGIIGALLVSLWATEPCLGEPDGRAKWQRRGRNGQIRIPIATLIRCGCNRSIST